MSHTDFILDAVTDATGNTGIADTVYARRDILKRSGRAVAALTLTGMPLGVAVLAEQALAQTTESDPAAVLSVALKLEYLESAFYTNGFAVDFSLPFLSDELQVITQIAKHELAHITVLRAALGNAAPEQPALSSYDFTGGSGTGFGPFREVFGAPSGTAPDGTVVPTAAPNKFEFFKLAMLLEDLGVRAYKGGLTALMAGNHLSTALRIHSVESRHAAAIRLIRNSYSVYDPSGSTYTPPALTTERYIFVPPWSALDDAGGVGFVDYSFTNPPVYEGGVSQQDIANGTVVTTTNPDGSVNQTTVMAGVYGPSNPNQIPPTHSNGEDNRIQSSSQVADVPVVPVNSMSYEAFDEPIALSAAAALMAMFGAA